FFICNNFSFWTGNGSTDSADYHPGDTVIIIGSGFQPEETVTLHVAHIEPEPNESTNPAHQPWETVADVDGNISSFWIVDEDALYETFLLTADGNTSLIHAKNVFRDGIKTWTGAGADSKWSNAANWSGGVPGVGDEAVFNSV